MNEVKVKKIPGLDNYRFATEEEIKKFFNCSPGYLGPVGLLRQRAVETSNLVNETLGIDDRADGVHIVADREVAQMNDFVCGANERGFHITSVNWDRDLPEPDLIADLRNVVAGDPSPDGKGALAIERGIEVGHVFYLGTKYSQAMNATFLGENGKPQFFEMGCYGIGITRLPAAAIEQNHDDKGIIWPDAIAPFTVVLCPISPDRFPDVKAAADKLYAELIAAGVDVMLDDRNERPGAMFADWELIGVPHRVTIGDRGLKDGQLEYQHRRDAASTKVEAAGALDFLKAKLRLSLV